MSTELERARGIPKVFTKTSNDELGITNTEDFADVIDIMDISLPQKGLLTISYSLEIRIPSPPENSNEFLSVFILCTLDPTSPDLVLGGVTCHPKGEPTGGIGRGVIFCTNSGLHTNSFTWVEKVQGGVHKIVMRAALSLDAPPPQTFTNPTIIKRTLVVQAFPN